MAALAGGAWWAWPILFPSLPAGWLSVLARADAALLQNRPDWARSILTETPPSLSVPGWLQWEKRVHAVAVQTGAWDWAAETAALAQAQYPGNPELTAYRVWALLQARRPAEAVVAGEKVLSGTPWEGLLVQARVEVEPIAPDWDQLAEVLSKPSPEALEAYGRLTRFVSDPQLKKNALLSALGSGRLDEASRYLGVLSPEERERPPFDRLQALMAYDQGDWTRAAALLKAVAGSHPDSWMVLADVYLHLGNPSQAKIVYDQLLASSEGELPESLVVNRASLALADQDPGLALKILSRIVGRGGTTDRIRLLSLEARFQLGEREEVRKTLDAILEGPEETPLVLEAELLKGRLFPEWTSLPRLWSLVHRHPEFSPLVERLAWLLLVAQDYPGAHRALDLHEAVTFQKHAEVGWWVPWLRALIFASEDRLEAASESFAAVGDSWRDATYYAAWSLVRQTQAQKASEDTRKVALDDALEKIRKALELLPPDAEPEALHRRSVWLTRKAELELALVPLQLPARRAGLQASAIESLRQAIQLDPENLRASFLQRQATTGKETP